MTGPGPLQEAERVNRMRRHELHQPIGWYLISYRNAAQQSLGALLLQARGPTWALDRAELLGIHPGGDEPRVNRIPDSIAELPEAHFEKFKDRLLSEEELLKIGGWSEDVPKVFG